MSSLWFPLSLLFVACALYVAILSLKLFITIVLAVIDVAKHKTSIPSIPVKTPIDIKKS